MVLFELDDNTRILHVRPTAPLQKEDFGQLANMIDPLIEREGSLAGLVIESESFPGWESLGSLVRHFEFIKKHHMTIEKVALVTDANLAQIAAQIGSHFVAAEIKQFPSGQAEAAKRWITQARQ